MNVVLARAALADLRDIGRVIADDNPNRARTFIEELRESCRALGLFPELYGVVPRFKTLDLRRKPHSAYLIFYRVRDVVEIVRILHGARDIERILAGEA